MAGDGGVDIGKGAGGDGGSKGTDLSNLFSGGGFGDSPGFTGALAGGDFTNASGAPLNILPDLAPPVTPSSVGDIFAPGSVTGGGSSTDFLTGGGGPLVGDLGGLGSGGIGLGGGSVPGPLGGGESTVGDTGGGFIPSGNEDVINNILGNQNPNLSAPTAPPVVQIPEPTSPFTINSPFSDPTVLSALRSYSGPGITAPGVTGTAADVAGGSTPSLQLASGSGSGASASAGAAPAGSGVAAGTDLTSSLKKTADGINPLSAILGLGGLGYAIAKGSGSNPTSAALQNNANVAAGALPILAGTANQLTAEGQDIRAGAKPLLEEGANIRASAQPLLKEGADLRASAQPLLDEGKAIRDKAGNIVDKGAAYADFLATGTLPPALETQVNNALAAKRASLISNYATAGMPTDPNKNSSLRQELGQLEDQKAVIRGQLAQQLLTSGASLIGSGTSLTGAGTGVTGTGTSLINSGSNLTGAASTMTGAGTGVTNAGTNMTNSGSSLETSGANMLTSAVNTLGLSSNILKSLSDIDQTQQKQMGAAIANFAAALGKGGSGSGITLKVA